MNPIEAFFKRSPESPQKVSEPPVYETREYPIRAIVGIGNNFVQGFMPIFEYPDGSAGSINVWSYKADKETWSLVGFTDDEVGKIVYERELGSEHWNLKNILLSRKA